MRTVYRRGDRSKTKLIAKQVREGSNELHILEYLQTKQPRSPHIISLIEATPSITKEWLIQPKWSRCYKSVLDAHGVPGRDQLGWGLVKGLAYLHEHSVARRDIRPKNLVCAAGFRLQIVDFDLAMQVQDESAMTDEYHGTKREWMAREMGDQDGPTLIHSPIRADRWTCGRVLLRFLLVGTSASGSLPVGCWRFVPSSDRRCSNGTSRLCKVLPSARQVWKMAYQNGER